MARDRTARARIRQYLGSAGPVEDPSGHATGLLKEAISYSGSGVAFIQLVTAMERAGEIRRTIRGKRTYGIELTEAGRLLDRRREVDPALGPATAVPSAPVPPTAAAPVIDYDLLAKSLVDKLWTALLDAPRPLGTERDLPQQLGAADVARLQAEHTRLTAERDEYARRLEEARARLDDLLGVVPAPGRSQ
jgi:hypothetical protein